MYQCFRFCVKQRGYHKYGVRTLQVHCYFDTCSSFCFYSTFRSVSNIHPSLSRLKLLQNRIGADIIMALDDVVRTTITGPRIEEAMYRTLRWIDRCIAGKCI